jgi:hypothetical protein
MKSTILPARTLSACFAAAIFSQALLHAQTATPLKGVVGELPQANWKGDEEKSILYFDELRMGGAKTTRDDVDPAKQK